MFSIVLLLLSSCFAQDSGRGLRFRDFDAAPATFLTAINDRGEMAANVAGRPALVAQDGSVTPLPITGSVVAMNNRGQVLIQQDQQLALLQPDGTVAARTYPGSDRVQGYGLGESGVVVGWAAGVGAVVWDESGTPSALSLPLSGSIPGTSVRAQSINDAGEIAGAYSIGSGPYEVFRRAPDGFFRDVGRAVRFPSMMLSNRGDLYYSHSNPPNDIHTEIRSSSDAVVYAASDSYLNPKGSIPLFSGMSPNGQLLIGRYAPSQTAFVAEVCAVKVTPSETAFPLEGGTITITVQADADCEWYSEASGRQRGNGELTLNIPAAQTPSTTHVWIAWQELVIRQQGGACDYRLPGSRYRIGAEGGTIRVAIATMPDCTWRTTGNDHVDVSPAAGVGPGEVRITVKPSETPQDSYYPVIIADQTLTIFQSPATCRRQLTFPSELGAGSGAALLTQQTFPECHVFFESSVDWLRAEGWVRDSPSSSHQIFFYGGNLTGQVRAGQVMTRTDAVSTHQTMSTTAGALLVEPATGSGPRQKFRFTFAEPAGEPVVSIGEKCTIRQRGGFFPFAVDGTCQLNDAAVTTLAGTFRNIDLDVTVAERGPLRIISGTRSLGAFIATDKTPDAPRLTNPTPQTGAAGFAIDSDHGYGGTFRMVLESVNGQPIRTASLTFAASNGAFIRSCVVTLDVATRQLRASTFDGTGEARIGPLQLGATGMLETDACIVNGAGGAFTSLSADGSRAVWDVTVLFRSVWSGLRFASVEVIGGDGAKRLQPRSIYYTVDPQVTTPSVVLYNDLLRLGIAADEPIASARVAAGVCLFEYDSTGGLRAGVGQPCRLDLARSAAVATGNSLTLVLGYSGDSSGAGGALKVEATPVGGVASGWLQMGQLR